MCLNIVLIYGSKEFNIGHGHCTQFKIYYRLGSKQLICENCACVSEERIKMLSVKKWSVSFTAENNRTLQSNYISIFKIYKERKTLTWYL